MKSSKQIMAEIMLYYRYADRTNQTVDEQLNKLFSQLEEAKKLEKSNSPK